MITKETPKSLLQRGYPRHPPKAKCVEASCQFSVGSIVAYRRKHQCRPRILPMISEIRHHEACHSSIHHEEPEMSSGCQGNGRPSDVSMPLTLRYRYAQARERRLFGYMKPGLALAQTSHLGSFRRQPRFRDRHNYTASTRPEMSDSSPLKSTP